MQFREDTVPLSAINTNDRSFRITTNTAVKDLEVSIKTVGLINPPLLITKPTQYTIVSGFRRVYACQGLGWSAIVAKILDAHTPDIECAKLAITDNSYQRPLNLIEISRAIRLIRSLIMEEAVFLKTATRLGLPDSPAFLEKTESLCRLPWRIQQGVLSGSISLGMALKLGQIRADDIGEMFARIFDRLKLSLNKQREILDLVAEIAAREDLSIRDVLQESAFKELVDSDNFDKAQKVRMLRRYLKTRRFPEITKVENEFDNRLKRLRMGPGIKLIAPKNFETQNYTIQLHFTHLTDLMDRKARLDKLSRNPDFAALFEK